MSKFFRPFMAPAVMAPAVMASAVFAGLISINPAMAATSSNDFEVIRDGGLSSPNWVSSDFEGSHFRELLDGSLNAYVTSTKGGFDTAIAGNAPKTTTKDVHPETFVEGRFHAFGEGQGDWWYGPKISINWQENGPQDGGGGWFENYVIDSASRTPAQMEAWLLNDYEPDNDANVSIGMTEHNGSTYKHYLVYYRQWKQYWAIRQDYRNGGATSIKPILEIWSDYDRGLDDQNDGLSMEDRPFDDVKLNVESNGVLKQNFVICDTVLPAAYNSAPTVNPTAQSADSNWCSGPVGLLARLSAQRASVTLNDLESAGLEQLAPQYLTNYATALVDADYSGRVQLSSLQKVIDDVNASVDADIDRDGVAVIDDKCPGTPTYLLFVDADGCPTAQSFTAIATTPASGVFNFADLQEFSGVTILESLMDEYEESLFSMRPNSKAELVSVLESVNDNTDLDGDGVSVINDQCPNTKSYLPADATGCINAASFVAVASDPPSSIFSYEDLRSVVGSIALEQNMEAYEIAIARQKPASNGALESMVKSVNSQEFSSQTSGSSSSSGGGSVPLVLLLGLTLLAMRKKLAS